MTSVRTLDLHCSLFLCLRIKVEALDRVLKMRSPLFPLYFAFVILPTMMINTGNAFRSYGSSFSY